MGKRTKEEKKKGGEEDIKEEMIKDIEENGATARGRREYIKFLKGGALTLRQAVYANCFACMGYYSDGRVFCEATLCPLIAFQPYNPNKVKRVKNEDN